MADHDFANAFSDAIFQVLGVSTRVRMDERGFWLVRTSNLTSKFSYLLEYEPMDAQCKAMWLKGLFDSEGNAQLSQRKYGENSYSRRIAIYSANLATLERAHTYLGDLSIASKIRTTKHSAGHKGTKTVYELVLKAGKENYGRFVSLVGSNIERKQATLNAIVESYHPDLHAMAKAAQLKGAANRYKRNRMN